MFSKILDCPNCQFRFKLDHEGPLPESIVCPSCNTEQAASRYSVLVFCPDCQSKLKIPLDILYDRDNFCPQCGQPLDPETIFTESGFNSTFGSDADDQHQVYKRLLEDGTIFDKYQIIRLLGKGGMAEVYLAEHMLLKQLCALKLMRRGSASEDPVFIKRFLREAQLSYQIEHPNIVKVFDVGSDFKTGYLFIAMEYVQGQTLMEILRERQLDEDELNEVLISMASALQALEDANTVHRDIKPSNIMRDSDGNYKLMDLGIAKFSGNSQESALTLTMEQSTIGTPSYASPEQCRSAHSADGRSDIYSLGATIYHLASQRLPFDGETPVATILNVLQTEAEPLKNFRPDLSEKFVKLIAHMMQKDPLKRPQTPAELLEKISAGESSVIAGGTTLKKWTDKLYPSAHESRKKYCWFMLRLLLAVVIALIFIGNLIYLFGWAGKPSDGSKVKLNPAQRKNWRGETKKSAPEQLQQIKKNSPEVKAAPTTPVKRETPPPASPLPEKKTAVAVEKKSAEPAPKIPATDNLLSTQQLTAYGWNTSWLESVASAISSNIPLVIWLDDRNASAAQILHKEMTQLGSIKNKIQNRAAVCYLDLSGVSLNNVPFKFREAWRMIRNVCREDIKLPALLEFAPDMKLKTIYTADLINSATLRHILDSVGGSPLMSSTASIKPAVLQERLAECQSRLKMYEALPNQPLLREKVTYLRSQIKSILEQISIRQEVQQAKKNFSQTATQSWKRRYEENMDRYFRALSQPRVFKNGQQRHESMQTQRQQLRDLMRELWTDKRIDPNIDIKLPNTARSVPLIEAAKRHGWIRIPEDGMLQEKRLDVNLLPRYMLIHKDYIKSFPFAGLEDVDSQPSIALALASYTKPALQFSVGKRYDMDLLCKFLLYAPKINDLRDSQNKNLMHYAAERGDPQLIKDLLLAGFNRGKERDHAGFTPWQYAMRRGNSNTVNMMKKLQLQTDDTAQDRIQLQFCESMRRRKYSRIKELLQQGASPYLPWVNDLNALQNACYMNDVRMVEILLDNGVDINHFEVDEHSISDPLQIAVLNGNITMLELLLRRGADPGMKRFSGSSSCSLPGFMVSLLKSKAHYANVLPLLKVFRSVKSGFDMNSPAIENKNVLVYCCTMFVPAFAAGARKEVVRYLLQNNASANVLHNGRPLYEWVHDKEIREMLERKSSGVKNRRVRRYPRPKVPTSLLK